MRRRHCRAMFVPRRGSCYFNPQWEHDYLFVECSTGALCLVCGSVVSSVKKFNVERHYKTSHVKDYGKISGDDRVNLVNMLKEDTSQPHQEDELNVVTSLDTTTTVPGTSHCHTGTALAMDGFPNVPKKQKLIPKTEPVDYIPESSMNPHFQNVSYQIPDEDEYTVVGKRLAFQLRGMSEDQRLLAEKIIGDVMYYGRVGKLSENCFQYDSSS